MIFAFGRWPIHTDVNVSLLDDHTNGLSYRMWMSSALRSQTLHWVHHAACTAISITLWSVSTEKLPLRYKKYQIWPLHCRRMLTDSIKFCISCIWAVIFQWRQTISHLGIAFGSVRRSPLPCSVDWCWWVSWYLNSIGINRCFTTSFLQLFPIICELAHKSRIC